MTVTVVIKLSTTVTNSNITREGMGEGMDGVGWERGGEGRGEGREKGKGEGMGEDRGVEWEG